MALRYSPLECNSCQKRQHLTNFKKSWNNSDEVSNSQFHFLGDVFAADVVVFAYKLHIASSLTARGSEKRRTTESPSLGETLFLGVSFSRFQKTIMKKVITVETLSTTATFFFFFLLPTSHPSEDARMARRQQNRAAQDWAVGRKILDRASKSVSSCNVDSPETK